MGCSGESSPTAARRRRAGLAVAVLAATVGASPLACDGRDDDRAVVEVTVEYPRKSAQDETASVHFWVLEPRHSDVLDGGCALLIARETDPYELSYRLHADFVVREAGASVGTSGEVPRRYALVYAEAVDYYGRPHASGCTTVSPSREVVHAQLLLTTPGTYDCADSTVEDDAPCEDGLFCTVGESCHSGVCRSGTPRDCSHVAIDCHYGACDEVLECHPLPGPMWMGCEDGDFCTIGDVCNAVGECESGSPRDCSISAGECRSGVCDDVLDLCVPKIDDTLPCADGYYCTENDECSGGVCGGTEVDCSIAENDCNLGVCSEALGGACAQVPILGGTTCDTNCTIGGTCSGGLCEGGAPTGVSDPEGPPGDATCADFIDNDCDTLFDEADPDCVL